jgi:hypothetical protein
MKKETEGYQLRIARAILEKLEKFSPEGLDEAFLTEKLDPVATPRILNLLVERDFLVLSFNNKEVGGKRRIYNLKENNK